MSNRDRVILQKAPADAEALFRTRCVLHCDLNNFFASVEMLVRPELRGKAIAVCGDPEKRSGIVLAKSEPAKKCGVKTGMAIWEAKQLCPEILIVSKSCSYSKYSRIVRDIYYRYTDKVEAMGGDECYLDVTESLQLLTKNAKLNTKNVGEYIADNIRETIKKEVGLTVSIGVSWNKTYAKLGSDLKKPDATTVISRDNYKQVVYPLPVNNLLYVGRKTVRLLEKLNVHTIGDLAEFDPKVLAGHIGINAYRMVEAARGDDRDEVTGYDYTREVKSVGNGTTLPHDLTTLKEIEQVVYLLSEEVAFRMRKKGVKGHTVSLSVRNTSLAWSGAQESVACATNASQTITATAMRIFKKIWICNANSVKPVMSLRVAVSNLTKDSRIQLSLLDDMHENKNDKLSAVFDDIRFKYGSSSVMFANGIGGEFQLHFDIIDE